MLSKLRKLLKRLRMKIYMTPTERGAYIGSKFIEGYEQGVQKVTCYIEEPEELQLKPDISSKAHRIKRLRNEIKD